MAKVYFSREALLLGTLLSGSFIGNVDLAVVNIAAPSIRETLGASGAELQLVVSGYIISYAMLLIVGARLGAIFGFGRVFQLGVAAFTISSAVCGLAPNTFTLIGARIAQGAGGALMVAQVLSGIQLSFTGQQRLRAIGAYAIALSAGAVAGQIVGGVIVAANFFDQAWRPAFLVNIPLGIALLTLAARVLPMTAPHRTETGLDMRGVLALAAAMLLLIVPLTFGREAAWPAWTWLCLALSVPALALFVRLERQATANGQPPLVQLAIFAEARITWHLVAAAGSLATYFAMLFVLALYLQQGLGKSPLYSGLALVSWVAAFGLSGPVLARMSRVQTVAVTGYVTMACAYFGIAASVLLGQADNAPVLVTLLGIGGLGFGLGRNASIADMTNTAGPPFAADLSGVINTASQVAGAAGVALFGSVYLMLAPAGGAQEAVPAFATVSALFGLTALAVAAGLGLSTWQVLTAQPSVSAPSSPYS